MWTSTKSEKHDDYLRLVYACDTDIRRFKKIKSEANPYDERKRQIIPVPNKKTRRRTRRDN